MEDSLVLIGLYILFIIIVFYCECMIRRTKPKNNVHFYIARDKNGELFLYIGKPVRGRYAYRSKSDGVIHLNWLNIKKYGLNEHDYINLKWGDEPVEVFLNLEN